MAYDNERRQFEKEKFNFVEIEVNGNNYRFCDDRDAIPAGLNAIPTLKSSRITPATIDLNGGLGLRAKLNVTIAESQDYTEFGTLQNPVRFWANWRARNPFYLERRISLYTGYLPNGVFDESNFIRRDYLIESFGNTAGRVSITGKDPLKLASNDRTRAPFESRGELTADILADATTFTITPASAADDYPASNFEVRIGDEVILVGTRTGATFSNLTRAQRNTIADDQSEGDKVQLCLVYEAQTVDFIVNDLLTTYAGIDSSFIPLTEWQAEVSNAFTTTYSTIITEPIGVSTLIKEFADSAPHYLYWDDRDNLIRLVALKQPPEEATTLTWEANLLADTVTVQDRQDMRISTVVCNFGQFDPTRELDDVSNYRQTYVREDSDSVTNYRQRAYKTIYSRWINSDNRTAAILMSARIGRRFADAPRQVTFALDDKDVEFWTGGSVNLETDLILDNAGDVARLPYQILSAQETKDRPFGFTALEHTYGPPVDGDEDAEDPNVRLIFLNDQFDRLDIGGGPRTLRQVYESVFGTDPIDPALDIRFIFDLGCVAGSDDAAFHAVDTGTWPTLTTPILLDVRGLIVGRGGDGADTGLVPTAGGPALNLQTDVRINNTGIIGGGGAGGTQQTATDPTGGTNMAFAAGGGGAGFTNGSAGLGTRVTPPDAISGPVIAASNGTNTAGGAGGTATAQASLGSVFIATGGDGGGLGQGTPSGATAGNAIDRNGNTITFVNMGDIRGTIS